MQQIDLYLNLYIYSLAIILGSIFASFINCMAWRIVHGESVWHGRSHCPTCGHQLQAIDLIPIVSYICLGGKCRYCKTKVAKRYVLIEILLAIVFVSFVWKYGISAITIRYLVLSCILLGLALVDFDSYEIPDGFIIVGILWWLMTVPLIRTPIVEQLKLGVIGGITIGGGILILSLIMDKILQKESMGGGDIKLFFMLGLYMGPSLGLFNLNLSCILGVILVGLMKSSKIPFGPAIVGASWITFLWGWDIINWYWTLFV